MDEADVDLVIDFRYPTKKKADVSQVEAEYTGLVNQLTAEGLRVAGKATGTPGQIIICVSDPLSDPRDSGPPPSTSERHLRLYTRITAPLTSRGLSIASKSPDWKYVNDVALLHDKEFDKAWLRSLVWRRTIFVLNAEEVNRIRSHFGESTALYFWFQSYYTNELALPAFLGVCYYFFLDKSFSPIYSASLLVWAVMFLEKWRQFESRFVKSWGRQPTEASSNATRPSRWWVTELKMAITTPIMVLTSLIWIITIMTLVFFLEAFFVNVYKHAQANYHQFAQFLPTVIFVLSVPPFLAIYQLIAAALTRWERHPTTTQADASLVLKVLPLTATVSFFGLFLTALFYLPFGEEIMWYFHILQTISTQTAPGSTLPQINRNRLRHQLFDFTITLQIVPLVAELVVPFVLRWVFRKLKGSKKTKGPMEDAVHQLSLPVYDPYKTITDDLSMLVIQFGYIVLWSTCWPLAPLALLIINTIKLRADAFKLTTHYRRPIPTRKRTLGPWINAFDFTTWLGAITNPVLILIFGDSGFQSGSFRILSAVISWFTIPTPAKQLLTTLGRGLPDDTQTDAVTAFTKSILPGVIIVLACTHALSLVKTYVRHLYNVFYIHRYGSDEAGFDEEDEDSEEDYEDKDEDGDEEEDVAEVDLWKTIVADGGSDFWKHDEGLSEIQRKYV